MSKIIRTLEKFINENNINDIYNPKNYLEDFYVVDFNDEVEESKALEEIQAEIDYVRNLDLPIKIYRGINTITPDEYYDGSSWSTDKHVAESFGNKIYVGLVKSLKDIDIEQTIRTRIINEFEREIYIPDFNSVEILEVYEK